jgi:hypothetical protein
MLNHVGKDLTQPFRIGGDVHVELVEERLEMLGMLEECSRERRGQKRDAHGAEEDAFRSSIEAVDPGDEFD